MRYRIEILPILQIYIGNIIRIACIYRTTYHIHILFPSLNPCIRQTDIDEIIPTSPSTVVNNDILTSKTYTQPVLVQNIIIEDRKSTRLNSSHVKISYAVFCLKKKKNKTSAGN